MASCHHSPVISFDKVSFSYGQNAILSNASFSVCDKDFAAIVGPNGSGKTTVLKLILGLLTPQSGSITVLGEPAGRLNNRIGYVSQHAQHDSSFPVSVYDVVLMGRVSGKFFQYTEKDHDIVRDSLAKVAMEDFSQRHFFTLSGGQKQRVLIARALACCPDTLILDEATSNLDVESENGLYELLSALNEELTILMVSHDLGFVSQNVKSVICVTDTVKIHPTSELTGDLISEMYGGNMRLIRHDHRCSQEGHRKG